ncbi:sensor histidine kinase, partial [Leucobacter sp. M11]|uniref:sensor histidine kinase n=1 Tax=Leucobacter sp. M11 TaxID=2993565 RepID=UPI002D80916E
MGDQLPARPRFRSTARFRLALSYAVFLLAAGAVVLVAVFLVLWFIPSYPMIPANAQEAVNGVPTRGQILRTLLWVSAWVMLALALIGTFGGWFLAGWVLRPLQEISAAARLVASGNLDHRIALAGPRDEFRELADSFDLMLERLSDAFETQERFAANASHELRTPLAVSATMLEVAAREPGTAAQQQLVRRLSETNQRAISLTEALLNLADANAINQRFEPLSLGELAAETLAEAEPELTRRGVSAVSEFARGELTGDPVLLRQMLSNLVHNAIRHNTPGGTLWLRVSEEPDGVRVTVWNTGEALSDEALARLTEPFY